MAVRQLSKSTIAQGLPRSSKFWDGITSLSDFQLIETVSLSGTQASVTFSNLNNYSSDYKHLQIRWVGRTIGTTSDRYSLSITFNGDTTASNYAIHHMVGNGSSFDVSGISSNRNMTGGISCVASDAATSNIYGSGVVDIVDAYSTNKNKTIRSLTGQVSGNPRVQIASGLYINTSAISSITLEPNYDGTYSSWKSGSRFSLYGIKG